MNIFDLSFTGIWIKAGWMSMMSIITGLLAWRIAGLAKIDNVPANDSAQAAESARAELAALKKEADKAHAELRNLKTVSGSDDKKSAAKDSEIKRLSAQLVDTQARQEASENRFAQLKETEKAYAGAESDAQRDKAEIEKQKQMADGLLDELEALKVRAADDTGQLAAKDSEIKRLSAQLADTQAHQEASENRLKERLAGMAAQQELSEKKLSRMKKSESDAQRDKAEIEKQKQIADGLLDELDRLKADSSAGKEEPAAKDSEIKRLSAQLADTQARQEAYENRLAQLKEMEKAQDTEIKRLRQQLAGSSAGKEELAAKDSEIKRLNAQLADTQARQEAYENRLAQFKKIESDMQRLESETEERRKSSHDIKRRVEESRMKMRLLSEKAKENVELLASFAGGKEFDEFRKSIHLDEIIQKHEDEIKELRIKNMDLEKGIK